MNAIYRLFLTSIFISVIFSSTFANRVTFSKYLQMSDDDRQGLIDKYIKTKGNFHYVKISNYEVFCDESPELTLKMAILMDDFFIRFKKMFKKKFKKNNRPLLYVCKDKISYLRTFMNFSGGHRAPEWSAGLYTPYKGGALFGNYQYKDQCIKTLKHEGTHQLLDFYIENRIATWFNEGTATNFETWDMVRTVENNISNDLYSSHYPRVISDIYPDKGFIPLTKLMRITGQQWNTSSRVREQYASSWASIHYMLSTKKGKALYNKLISAFRAGKTQDIVLKKSLAAKMERDIKKHIETIILPHNQFARPIMMLMEKEMYEQAYKLTKKYLYEYPESKEAEFYNYWLEHLSGKHNEKTTKNIKNLDRKKYKHPEMNFALAQTYFKDENFGLAKRYAKLAVANNDMHKKAKALLSEIIEADKQAKVEMIKKFK